MLASRRAPPSSSFAPTSSPQVPFDTPSESCPRLRSRLLTSKWNVLTHPLRHSSTGAPGRTSARKSAGQPASQPVSRSVGRSVGWSWRTFCTRLTPRDERRLTEKTRIKRNSIYCLRALASRLMLLRPGDRRGQPGTCILTRCCWLWRPRRLSSLAGWLAGQPTERPRPLGRSLGWSLGYVQLVLLVSGRGWCSGCVRRNVNCGHCIPRLCVGWKQRLRSEVSLEVRRCDLMANSL